MERAGPDEPDRRGGAQETRVSLHVLFLREIG